MTTAKIPSTAIDFLFLNEEDMYAAGVTDIAQCVDVMEETLVLLAQGDYKMAGLDSNSHGAMITFPEEPQFAGMPKDGPDRRFMAMPAYLGGRFNNTGVKWYGSNAENRMAGLPRSIHTFVLNDTVTGAPKSIMSANLLSAYRTGAVPGVGVKLFARESATTLAVIGPGVMGRTTTEACLALRPGITTIKIKGRSERGVTKFATWALEKFPEVEVIAVDSVEEATKDADIVVAATTTDAAGSEAFPFFKKSWIKPGATLLLPAAARFDDDFLQGEVRLVVDYMGLYDAWAEEYGTNAYQLLGIPGTHWHDMVRSGELERDKIQQIGDICSGNVQGRNDDSEIFLYSVGGMPVEDVAWATQIYENALDKGIGTSLNLWESPRLA
ncbi:tyramine oxidase subunit B [Corynebacterium lubricantis]|uniref:tyramine oxidase subunit B n=1 Tax=Corynebacterium lubricantis TaxID=541095 RepID=UPI00037CEF0F|nr:tyramine oxidase subunit B [Corynebacterium lubricantis]